MVGERGEDDAAVTEKNDRVKPRGSWSSSSIGLATHIFDRHLLLVVRKGKDSTRRHVRAPRTSEPREAYIT